MKNAVLASCLFLSLAARADTGLPPTLRHVGIDQHLNGQIPLDLTFRDESGKSVRLGDYFGRKPVLLNLVYYECPMLCTLELSGLVRGLRGMSLRVGRDFNVVTVSFNPRETPPLAAAKKENYIRLYGHPEAAAGWHFLTGAEPSIDALAQAVGFRYVYDPKAAQYAHATGIMVATPQGKLARYFYGIDYPPGDLRLGLVEASQSKIGTPVDSVLLFCYHYDPNTGKYSLMILQLMQAAGVATVLGLGVFLLVLFRREQSVAQACLPVSSETQHNLSGLDRR
jgi:protein SCO1/2